MRTYRLLVLCAALLAACPVNANLVVNGSFEMPNVPTNSFTNYASGSTAIMGWTVVGIDSAVVEGGFMTGGITFQAQDGDQWIDLAGVLSNSPSSGVSQNIPTTAGQSYLLSFFVGSASNGAAFSAATVDLSIDGSPRTPFFNPTAPSNMLNWRQFIVPFVATSNSTNLTFFNGSASTNFLSGLDNISLVAGSGLAGDFDNDGDVDGRDFLAWQRGESPNPFSPGDLTAWQAAYNGGLLSALHLPPSALHRAVPEPGACWLIGVAVMLLSYRGTGLPTSVRCS